MPLLPPLKHVAFLLALSATVFLSACDTHDHDDDDDHFGQLERVEVRDRASGALYASFVRANGAFEGEVHLHHDEEVALNVLFFDEEGREADLGETEEFSLGIRLAEAGRDGVAGTPGIVEFEVHGDHADITALAVGETHLVFQLMHGGHSDGDSPALLFEVEDH